MILFGCLLAFSAAVAPRLVLILAWIFSDRWPLVWQGDWIMPLLGIIFLPYTTIMYLLTWTLNGGIEGWDWLWIAMGVFLDIWKWSVMFSNRKEAAKQTQKYYPSGAPRSPTGTTGAAAVAAAPKTASAVPSTLEPDAEVTEDGGSPSADPEEQARQAD